MPFNTQVIVWHSFTYLLSRHNIDTFDESAFPANEEEKEILQLIRSCIEKFYAVYNERIQQTMDLLKITFERLSDCLENILWQSFPYAIDWSHIISYMTCVVEAMVRYIRKDSAENTIDFTWMTVYTNFEKDLGDWIQKQGGWLTLKEISTKNCF